MRTFTAPRRQRGVVLLFALIALLVLMIGAAAMVRSFNSSLFQAGNIGFKRDLQNQGERTVTAALAAFNSASGVLATKGQRANSSTTNTVINYSATILSVDAQGIPDVLTRDDRVDQINNSFVLNPAYQLDLGNGVTALMVVDRLCASAGDEKMLGVAQCAMALPPSPGTDQPGSADSGARCAGCTSSAAQFVLYRLSARITGPRNTQSFFQSTFSVPS